MKLSLLALVLSCSLLSSQETSKWTTADTVFETTWQVLNVVDWRQTSNIHNTFAVSNTDPLTGHQTFAVYEEGNKILGKHPKQSSINQYFVTTALLHYTVSRVLPTKGRHTWQAATIVYTLTVVRNNVSVGVKLSW